MPSRIKHRILCTNRKELRYHCFSVCVLWEMSSNYGKQHLHPHDDRSCDTNDTYGDTTPSSSNSSSSSYSHMDSPAMIPLYLRRKYGIDE